jgi:hypothetical protein
MARSTAFGSTTLPSTKSTSSKPLLSNFSGDRTSTRTLQPASRSRLAKTDPVNPVAPVTNALGGRPGIRISGVFIDSELIG